MEEGGSTVFTPAVEGMKNVKSDNGEMLTKPFLDVCKEILPVIDKFGAAMALVKSDIGGNISRLETKYQSNPEQFNQLYSLVSVEVEAKTAKGSSSCTNGLLWLTRAMDFLVALFRNLLEHPDWPMSQACTDSYGKTLKKWHGWLASSAFTVTSLIHSIIFFFGSLQVEPCDAKPRPYPCIIWPIFIELYFLGFITVMPFGAF